MRLKKKILRGVTAAVLAAVLLTACAGGGEAVWNQQKHRT